MVSLKERSPSTRSAEEGKIVHCQKQEINHKIGTPERCLKGVLIRPKR